MEYSLIEEGFTLEEIYASLRIYPIHEEAEITVLSYGGGQDSAAILAKIIHDPLFRSKYIRGRLIVVFADTGDEHEETYLHIEEVKLICEREGIEFYVITPDMGFHPVHWRTLRHHMEHYNVIMGKAFARSGSCTDNLKIKPIYRFLADLIHKAYGFDRYGISTRMENGNFNNAAIFKKFSSIYGKINMIIGIAKGEESRISVTFKEKWMALSIQKVYPLIEEEMDRAACQAYIESVGEKVPPPSNCMLCPWMSEIELLWLFVFRPKDFYYWVEREKAKFAKDELRGVPVSHGVWGDRTLEQVLEGAIKKYGHWTKAMLDEYKRSHGHCSKNKH